MRYKRGGIIVIWVWCLLGVFFPIKQANAGLLTDNIIVETYLEEIPESENDYFKPQVSVCHKWLLIIESCDTLTYREPLTLDGARFCGFIEDKYNFCVYMVDLFNDCDPKNQPQGLIKEKVDCVVVPLAPSPPPYCEDKIAPPEPVFILAYPPASVLNDFYNPTVVVQNLNDQTKTLTLKAVPDTTDSITFNGITYKFKTKIVQDTVCVNEISPQEKSVGCLKRKGFMPEIGVDAVSMSRSQPQIKVWFKTDPNAQSITLAASQTKPLYGVEFTAIRYTKQHKLCVFASGATTAKLYVAKKFDADGNRPGPVIRPYDPNNPADLALYEHANATEEVRPNTSIEQGNCIDLPPSLLCEAKFNPSITASIEAGVNVAPLSADSQVVIDQVQGQICVGPSECTQDGDWTHSPYRNTWLDYRIGTGPWTHPLATEVSGNKVTLGNGSNTGDLIVRVNDAPGAYSNNSGSYQASISITTPYPESDTCPAGTTEVK